MISKIYTTEAFGVLYVLSAEGFKNISRCQFKRKVIKPTENNRQNHLAL